MAAVAHEQDGGGDQENDRHQRGDADADQRRRNRSIGSRRRAAPAPARSTARVYADVNSQGQRTLATHLTSYLCTRPLTEHDKGCECLLHPRCSAVSGVTDRVRACLRNRLVHVPRMTRLALSMSGDDRRMHAEGLGRGT